jgi:prevent-host-death family protein
VDTSKDIEPITKLERDTAELIARAKERQVPIVIAQNGRATAVLQDVGTYERQRRALPLLELLAQGERDFEAGRTMTQAQVEKRLGARLRRAKSRR